MPLLTTTTRRRRSFQHWSGVTFSCILPLIMNICLFEAHELGKPLAKQDERTRHIVNVLHKKIGDRFEAGIIGGSAGTAVITHIAPAGADNEGALSFTFEPKSDGKPLYPLMLVVGFPRPIQLRRLLRDVAGLGVCAVHLTGTELGEKSYRDSTLVERGAAYQMLLDGTAQAASTHVPALYLHQSLAECLKSLAAEVERNYGAVRRVALDNIRPQCSLGGWLHAAHSTDGGADMQQPRHTSDESATHAAHSPTVRPASALYIAAIGSERGWTDRERTLMETHGFTRCGMGCRVLRTETAATVACSLILDHMGMLS